MATKGSDQITPVLEGFSELFIAAKVLASARRLKHSNPQLGAHPSMRAFRERAAERFTTAWHPVAKKGGLPQDLHLKLVELLPGLALIGDNHG